MPIPTDPLLAQQWHLDNPSLTLLDLNVTGVWNPLEGPAYTGAGTSTVVIDDGFDYLHADLAVPYNEPLDYDFADEDLDPFGLDTDAQGTAIAGLIGADDNGTGAVGIAFDTTLVGYRVSGVIGDFWLQNIRDAIDAAATSAMGDVATIGQAISDDNASEFGFGYDTLRFAEIAASIETAVDSGRGGLGTTIVKSAGDARTGLYDVNADGWTNNTKQIVVAAVDQDGFVSAYSSYGAALLVSGFGTPGEVVTTDRTGAAGYDATDYTAFFNGTAAAAAMVSGVVALMYDANPGLGWRDVQTILGVSARHVGSEVGGGIANSEQQAWSFNGAGTWNGGGQHFSNDYGYGLVDALAAVRLAETWLLTGTDAAISENEFSNTIDVLNVSTLIPGGDANGLTFSGDVEFDDSVERVTVRITFETTYLGDMLVYLISPDGTESLLVRNQADSANFNGTWTFESQAFRGERAAGTWGVRIVDENAIDLLTVTDIVITTFGADTLDDRYIYTDEYSAYAGLFGHAVDVTDANGGTDTVNAAAVTSASDIYLDGSNSSIDGIVTTFTGIENAIGGDGADTLFGSAGANALHGMRGDDLVSGDAGNDALYGGDGSDQIYGDGDADLLDGGAGDDELYGGAGVDTLFGGDGSDYLDAGEGTETVSGGAGNDILFVGAGEGSDTLDGGADVDTADFYDLTTIDLRVDLVAGTWGNLTTVFGGLIDIESAFTSFGNDVLIGDDEDNIFVSDFGNDMLSGAGGNDTLYGGFGEDTLDGGGGFDKLIGGDGGDVYIIDSTTDTITETEGGTGIDEIRSSISFNFGVDFIELITLTGTGDTFVFGGDTAQRIVGNSGNNDLFGYGGADTLEGGAGADTLTGGTGDDTYVNPTGDIVVELAGNANGARDLIRTGASYNLASAPNVEDITLTGTGNFNAIGGTGTNRLTGNSGKNILNGGGGNDFLAGLGGIDTMNGGPGNDIYLNPEAIDIIGEALGAAGGLHDRIQTLYSFNISTVSNVEDITLVGAANVNAIGNNLANILVGNPGNNTLLGGGGTDTITGGAGNDTMNGGNGADLFKFAASNTGADRIDAFSTAQDRFDLSGGSFSARNETGGDTILTHAGGTIRIAGVIGLSVGQWNALVDGGMMRETPVHARVAAFHDDAAIRPPAALGHFAQADFL